MPHLARPEEIGDAADVLAVAFHDDPLFAFMLRRTSSRHRTLRTFFKAYLAVAVGAGRVTIDGDPIDGVAIWESPQAGSTSVSLRQIGPFLPLLATAYPAGLRRARPITNRTEAMHKTAAPGPHYYLDNLAVRAGSRGRGVAGRLVRPVVERADRDGVPAYTDTVNPENVTIYEHLGFALVDTAEITSTGITVFGLRHDPPADPG